MCMCVKMVIQINARGVQMKRHETSYQSNRKHVCLCRFGETQPDNQRCDWNLHYGSEYERETACAGDGRSSDKERRTVGYLVNLAGQNYFFGKELF